MAAKDGGYGSVKCAPKPSCSVPRNRGYEPPVGTECSEVDKLLMPPKRKCDLAALQIPHPSEPVVGYHEHTVGIRAELGSVDEIGDRTEHQLLHAVLGIPHNCSSVGGRRHDPLAISAQKRAFNPLC